MLFGTQKKGQYLVFVLALLLCRRKKGQYLVIHHRADHSLHEYLRHFVAALNTRASAALCELDLLIPRCRTDQFYRSFLPVAVRLWNLLPSDVFSGSILTYFKSAMNLFLQRA